LRVPKYADGKAEVIKNQSGQIESPDKDNQKKRRQNRDAFIFQSERAFGRKRRRIDGWVDKVRDSYF
jgi:hypothetical protein